MSVLNSMINDFVTAAFGQPLWLRITVGAFLGALLYGGLPALWDLAKTKRPGPPTPTPMTSPTSGGGKGGSAKVDGSGIAIGGPGGPGGKYGSGGGGGSAEVQGDGTAVGGAGGAAGDEGIWRPPAKSGYEIHQRTLGLPVDPLLRQYGRGGAGAGYEPKLKVVENLRSEYFKQQGLAPVSHFEDINAVPLDYLNEALARQGQSWRVRVVDDEYEFFVPQ